MKLAVSSKLVAVKLLELNAQDRNSIFEEHKKLSHNHRS